MSLKNKIKFNFPHVSEYTERGDIEKNLTDEERKNIKSDVKIEPMCFDGDMNLLSLTEVSSITLLSL